MTVRAWFGRNLDQGGAGGGAQDARGARVSARSLGLKELMEACTPLERIVGKGPARPPV